MFAASFLFFTSLDGRFSSLLRSSFIGPLWSAAHRITVIPYSIHARMRSTIWNYRTASVGRKNHPTRKKTKKKRRMLMRLTTFFFSLLLAFSNRKYMHLPIPPHIRFGSALAAARVFKNNSEERRKHPGEENISVENILCNFIEYQKAIKHMHQDLRMVSISFDTADGAIRLHHSSFLFSLNTQCAAPNIKCNFYLMFHLLPFTDTNRYRAIEIIDGEWKQSRTHDRWAHCFAECSTFSLLFSCLIRKAFTNNVGKYPYKYWSGVWEKVRCVGWIDGRSECPK